MINKSFFVFFWFLFINTTCSIAQDSIPNDTVGTEQASNVVNFFEVNFDYLLPGGSFKNNIDKNLAGFSLSYLKQLESKSNYSFWGLHLSRFNLGGRSGLVSDNGFSFNDDTETIYYTLHFLYRHYLPFFYKTIEPYVELAAGPQTIYTRTNTTFIDELSTTEINFDETSFGLSYGLSLGVSVKIYQQFFLGLSAGYFSSNASTYLVHREDLDFEFPVDNFDRRNSQLNYFKFRMGVLYSF